jgi:hypothetical protein
VDGESCMEMRTLYPRLAPYRYPRQSVPPTRGW